MTAPYENAEFIELGTIMPPEKFRAEGSYRVPP